MALPRFAEGLPEYPPRRRRSYRNIILFSSGLAIVLLLFYNSRHHVQRYYDKHGSRIHSSPVDDSKLVESNFDENPKLFEVGGEPVTFDNDILAAMSTAEADLMPITIAESSTTTITSSSTSTRPTSTGPAPKPSGPPIPDDIPIDHSDPKSRLTDEMQKVLDWSPPDWAIFHLPPYTEFIGRDYDPNRWENFTINDEFFESGYLTAEEASARPPVYYDPYPHYNSQMWRQQWKGDFVSCEGVQGKILSENPEEKIKAYSYKPQGFPGPQVGSWDAVGVDGSVCFDRFSRLGAFGMGEDRDFGNLKLGDLQNKCLDRNKNRYEHAHAPALRPGKGVPFSTPEDYMKKTKAELYQPPTYGAQYKNRTAILIRSWEGYEYLDNDVQAIRSLVSEMALQSGGEYQVFLFVNIKDEDDSIFTDENAYQAKLEEIPDELRDMTILWTEKQMSSIYPAVNEYRVNLAQFMPVQWFMETHPEFEYVWNWEMDARLIGHHYHFVEAINDFALRQPRKYLWERNARYYLPNIHGSYPEFFKETNRQIKESPYVATVWGPMLIGEVMGTEPPTTEAQDNFKWGVGEEADFISLLPIWDPARPTWGWKAAMWNYPQDSPRRAYINTHARYSKRLLKAMHLENLNGRHMVSEMWPTSIALHHGLKAVYAPQPIWMSHHWPDFYLDAVFNADGWGCGSFYNYSEPADDYPNQKLNHPKYGRGVAYNETLARLQLPQTGTGPNNEGAMGRWGQERDSPYNIDREHNFSGWSWYYQTDFAKIVYSRWLGYQQSFTTQTIGWRPSNEVDKLWEAGTEKWEQEHGRLCLPSMLLHPVKHMARPEYDDEDPETNGQQGDGQDDDQDQWPQFEQQQKGKENDGQGENQQQDGYNDGDSSNALVDHDSNENSFGGDLWGANAGTGASQNNPFDSSNNI